MSGELDVLSVGRGHLRVTIDEGDAEGLENARKMIEDMLARGAAIFVEQPDGSTRRVKKFNPKNMTYLIDDVPEGEKPTPARKKTPKKEVPVAKSRATAVGRTAGG